jgi:hypothetical protein
MIMKVVLALFGSGLLCASVVSGAGPMIVPVHPPVWFPSMTAFANLVPVESLSEPAGLLILGAGLVLLARPVRRK